MWDETDYVARWIHGICGVFLLPFGAFVEYYDWTHWGSFGYSSRLGRGSLGIGSIYVGIRCLWYAVTGRNNINFDYLNDR
jgi:hypothetical protein